MLEKLNLLCQSYGGISCYDDYCVTRGMTLEQCANEECPCCHSFGCKYGYCSTAGTSQDDCPEYCNCCDSYSCDNPNNCDNCPTCEERCDAVECDICLRPTSWVTGCYCGDLLCQGHTPATCCCGDPNCPGKPCVTCLCGNKHCTTPNTVQCECCPVPDPHCTGCCQPPTTEPCCCGDPDCTLEQETCYNCICGDPHCDIDNQTQCECCTDPHCTDCCSTPETCACGHEGCPTDHCAQATHCTVPGCGKIKSAMPGCNCGTPCTGHCTGGKVKDANGNCVCPQGKEEVNGQCVDPCPAGQTRDANGNCVNPCTGGKVPDANGNCVCPQGKEEVNGQCVDLCPADQTRDECGDCAGGNKQPCFKEGNISFKFKAGITQPQVEKFKLALSQMKNDCMQKAQLELMNSTITIEMGPAPSSDEKYSASGKYTSGGNIVTFNGEGNITQQTASHEMFHALQQQLTGLAAKVEDVRTNPYQNGGSNLEYEERFYEQLQESAKGGKYIEFAGTYMKQLFKKLKDENGKIPTALNDEQKKEYLSNVKAFANEWSTINPNSLYATEADDTFNSPTTALTILDKYNSSDCKK